MRQPFHSPNYDLSPMFSLSPHNSVRSLERALRLALLSLQGMDWQSVSPPQKEQIDRLLGSLSEAVLQARLVTHRKRHLHMRGQVRFPPR